MGDKTVDHLGRPGDFVRCPITLMANVECVIGRDVYHIGSDQDGLGITQPMVPSYSATSTTAGGP